MITVHKMFQHANFETSVLTVPQMKLNTTRLTTVALLAQSSWANSVARTEMEHE